jgi:polyisoprenoid-binding protein YceI
MALPGGGPMRNPKSVFALLVLVAASPPAQRLRYVIDPSGSDIAARVAFFGLASKTARFPKVSGGIGLAPADLTHVDLTVELDARALTAPDKVTLARLKGPKFFDVANHPSVRFVGRGLAMNGPSSGTVAGEITARGVTRPATLAVTFAKPPAEATGREPITLTGRTTIDRRAFGMTAYRMIVGRKVTITIRARMVPA